MKANRGYTFHEHYDKLGLINMNGRVYDPIVGRFLSVDPLVSNPLSAQSYNGYSYCLNNPLKYADPSGYISAPVAMTPYACDQETGRPLGMSGGASAGWDGSIGGGSGWYGSGSMGGGSIYYDYSTGTYKNRRGGAPVSSEAVKNYVEMYTISVKYLSFSGTRENPYMYLNAIVYSTDAKRVMMNPKPTGDNPNRYVLFPNRTMAEEYINRNADIYGKEIFCYILKDGKTIVGPWSDAVSTSTYQHVSPRFLERFNKEDRTISFGGKRYPVDIFSHNHFFGSEASVRDMKGFEFFNYYGIIPTIYFNGSYYRYDSTGTKGVIIP